jgi:DNA-binding NarL/FixJ family response regulator
MPETPRLDPAALLRLRGIVDAIHKRNGQSVPLAQLVDLSTSVSIDAGVTIDFEASTELGQPFLVLRMPPPNASAGSPDARLACLSPREREIVRLLAEGLSNKQIAARLAIKLATVKDHVHRVLQKTGLPNRAAVAAASRDPTS